MLKQLLVLCFIFVCFRIKSSHKKISEAFVRRPQIQLKAPAHIRNPYTQTKTFVFVFSMQRSASTTLSKMAYIKDETTIFHECLYANTLASMTDTIDEHDRNTFDFFLRPGNILNNLCQYRLFLERICKRKYCVCKINNPSIELDEQQIQTLLSCSPKRLTKTIVLRRNDTSQQYKSYVKSMTTGNWGTNPMSQSKWDFTNKQNVGPYLAYNDFLEMKNRWYDRLENTMPETLWMTFEHVVKRPHITRQIVVKHMTSPKLWHGKNFIIAGAMKGGTTFLVKNILKWNDEIEINGRESDYWTTCTKCNYVDYVEHLGSLYSQKVIDVNKMLGDKNPEYMLRPYTAKLLKKHMPWLKLIFVLRNPVDRLYSQYWHEKKYNAHALESNNVYSFEDFLNWPDSSGVGYAESYIRGKYAMLLNPYYDQFSKNQILILFSEELWEKYEYSNIQSFLGIDTPLMAIDQHHIANSGLKRDDMTLKQRKRLENYYKPFNIELCKFLKHKGYPCPSWSIYKSSGPGHRSVSMKEHFLRLQSFTQFNGKRIVEIGSDQYHYIANMFLDSGAAHVDVTNLNIRDTKIISERKRITHLDATKIDAKYEESSVDIIFGIAVVEHMPHTDAFLNGAFKVLRPGGYVYMHGGPIWSAPKGHHIFTEYKNVLYKFSDKDCILQSWEHLLYNETELKHVLMRRNVKEDIASHVSHWVHHSNEQNRYPYEKIHSYFKNSKFTILEHIAASWNNWPSTKNMDIISNITKRPDVSGVVYILQKPLSNPK